MNVLPPLTLHVEGMRGLTTIYSPTHSHFKQVMHGMATVSGHGALSAGS
jgi:hypothetical protein